MMGRRKNLNNKFGFTVVMEYNLLKDIVEITMGQSPDSLSYNNVKRGLPFYQGNADFGELYPIAKTWCDAPKKTAKKNDILISVRAPIGAINYTRELCCIGRGLAAITVEDDIERNYIYYFLKAKNSELINQGTGSTFKAIGRPVLEMLKVPAISEKQKILIIKSMDFLVDIIKLRKKELILLDKLIKARFIEMFGDPVNNDKKWIRDSVERLCKEIYGGGTPSKSHPEYYEGGKIPWITSKDMKKDILIDSQIYINEDGVSNSTARIVPKNSVIMVIRSGILKHTLPIAINAVPITVNQDLKVFIPGNRIVTKFLAYQFKMMERDILSGVRAVTADNIEFDALKRRELIVPPIELQNQFADFVRQVDKSREEVKKSLEKTQQLYDSLMQEYFG